MAQLKIRKNLLDLNAEVHIDINGSSVKVNLVTASQDQLKILQEKGVDVFEKSEKEK